jgi:hypothetical protein
MRWKQAPAMRGKLYLDRRSRAAPEAWARNIAPDIQSHLDILRPEGLDALAYVAIVNVAAVDFQEVA